MSIAIELSQYAAARTVAALLSPFDAEQNLETARAFGRLYARCSAKRRERARTGVARAFPTLPLDTQRAIVDASIGHMFGLFMVDAFAMPQVVGRESWPDRVQIGGVERAMKHLVADKPCIFVTGHIGNWEILGYVLALMGFRMTALARPLDNRFLNDWLLGVRQKTGLRVITKFGATDEIQRVIESGGKIGFIADQNAGNDGLFVPFFSRLASTYKSIPLLAMRYELPIVCGYARRVGGAFRYEIRVTDVIEPADWSGADDAMLYIGARFNRAIEWMVRESPDQYLWVHRRWNSRPKHEREGEPMPDRLRRKLAALPWMTDALLEDLARPIDAPTDPAATCPPGAPIAIDPRYRVETRPSPREESASR
ncbi:MAG: lysophospholipid acyltransferase family protein [Planctomycetaceae bacterium]|nr:lysophospholipid acyltransferase family protein [Planctomycetaceae bacterium]